MKKHLLLLATLFVVGFGITGNAQVRGKYKKETIVSNAMSNPDPKVDGLQKAVNQKNNPVQEDKSRGNVYGPDYSDVVVDNWTGFYIDIYVNGNYRGTVSPWDKRVTWAIPGTNTLYAKAVFDDGSYLYWGPKVTYTGYQYTWKLNP